MNSSMPKPGKIGMGEPRTIPAPDSIHHRQIGARAIDRFTDPASQPIIGKAGGGTAPRQCPPTGAAHST